MKVCTCIFELRGETMSYLNKFIPDVYVTDIYQITPELLKKQGIEGVMTDLDNTLVRWDQPHTTAEVVEWLTTLRAAGIKTLIISNNNQQRVQEFAEPLDISFIHKARKPLQKGFIDGRKQLQLPAKKIAVIGDQVMTDVFGGNRQGMYTILVDPIGEKEFLTTKFNRTLERAIVRHLYRKGLISWIR